MAGGFLDILIFAVIAAFIFFKLFNVLGRRTGHEQPPSSPVSGPLSANDDQEKIVTFPHKADEIEEATEPADSDEPDELRAGILQILQHDPSLDLEQFTGGAAQAFEMIITAYHAGELARVRNLLDDDVFESFTAGIEERELSQVETVNDLVSIVDVSVVEAGMTGKFAMISVRFESDQIEFVRDEEDRIIHGDPTVPNRVIDVWTFARNPRSRNPNWLLVATRSPN